jgi:hypothetical protein
LLKLGQKNSTAKVYYKPRSTKEHIRIIKKEITSQKRLIRHQIRPFRSRVFKQP